MAVFRFCESDAIVYRNEFILEQSKNRRVLHCGFTDSLYAMERIQRSQWLHALLDKSACDLWGVDVNEEGIEAARSFGFSQVVFGDIQNFETILPDHVFDLILAPDVIEHLANPGCFLSGAINRLRLQGEGRILLTTPNAKRLAEIPLWLAGLEISHSEHLVSFSPNTLRSLVEHCGGKVSGCYLYPCHTGKVRFSIGADNMTESILRFIARSSIMRRICRIIPALASGFALIVEARG